MLKIKKESRITARIYDENINIIADITGNKDWINAGYVTMEEVKYCIKQGFLKNVCFSLGSYETDLLKDEIIYCVYIKTDGDNIILEGFCTIDDYENSKWSKKVLLGKIKDQIQYEEKLIIKDIETFEKEEDTIIFMQEFEKTIPIEEMITKHILEIKNFFQTVENSAGNFKWKKEYEENEKLFCQEVLSPLFRRMNFNSSKYIHGSTEYGKDYILSDLDMFGQMHYVGVQVKAGNIDGKVNSKIDYLINQIEDAFSMPIIDMNTGNKYYISQLKIIISGRYSNNAKEKIINKVPRDKISQIQFLEKEDIEQLIDKYWNK